jgi:hypothetical protein
MHARLALFFVLSTALVAGCGNLTREEAATALEEASLSSSAGALTGSSIEISTNFTIGGAVEAAAQEIQTFVQTQLPCADVQLAGATLTIHYGARPGNCTYRGQTYAGTHVISVMSNQMGSVVVMHTWTDFHNDTMSVTGSAMVTWNATDVTRHVSSSLTWTRLSDHRMGTGTGDRTQMPLQAGLLAGFEESGEHTWTGQSGRWDLTIQQVQMRWVDPCPQSGRYSLVTPYGPTLTLTFTRTNATTIHVALTSGRNDFDFDVVTLP